MNNEEFKEKLIMTAKEARDIANKRNEETQKVESFLLDIGKLISKFAEEGEYSVVYTINYSVDKKIIIRIIDYLKSLGYRVTEDTYGGCFKKLIIEFYSNKLL